MVGDSLEHDIAGGAAAGWQTAFVRGGLHRAAFGKGEIGKAMEQLMAETRGPMPDYTLDMIGVAHAR